MDLEQIANALNLTRDRLESLLRGVKYVALMMAGAYFLASSASAVMMTGFMTKALVAFTQMSAHKHTVQASIAPIASVNYRDVEKAIKERNLFNQTGEFPEEKDPSDTSEQPRSVFDLNAPCNKPTLNVDLVGTIYLDGPDSVATLQEKGYSEADIYREGDAIIGNDKAVVARIERNRVIVNNNGTKECLELVVVKDRPGGDGFPSANGPGGATPVVADGSGNSATPVANDCNLDEKYVQDELGPGFGTIIQKARLVPNTTDNQMNGFKIFAIDPTSLLGKTGLKNGDIITQVNDVSLKQPEQGFALYQAFQDEKEVRIQILRGGTQPMTITCRIK